MKGWINDEDLREVDYQDVSEDDKDIGDYVTNPKSIAESNDLAVSDFHDQDLSLDHGRIVMTASEGLEGRPIVILTPPASPDQPGMQDPSKNVIVDETGFQSLASKRKKLSQKQRKLGCVLKLVIT